VPPATKSDTLIAEFVDIYAGGLTQKFLARWKNRPHPGTILWTFPLHDATRLAVRAVAGENGRVKTYVVLDRTSGTSGIAEDGSLFLASGTGSPRAARGAVLITRYRVPPLAVGPNQSAALNSPVALQGLVRAGRAR
jgi:hypothetical protein